MFYRLICPLLLCTIAALCEDAASLARKVAQSSRALDGYSLEGTVELVRSGIAAAGNPSTASAKFRIQVADHGRKSNIFYDNSEIALVQITNGSTLWTYLPKKKQYTKVEASTVESTGDPSEDGNILENVHNLAFRRFLELDKLSQPMEIDGQQDVKTAEGKIRCWVLAWKVAGTSREDLDRSTPVPGFA